MRAAFVALVVVAIVPGCLEAPSAALSEDAAASAVPAPDPFDTVFRGQVPLYVIEGLGHSRPSEDYTWAISQSGFLLNLTQTPAAQEVRLSWTALRGGQYMIMLHSHKAHGTNVYVEHISSWTTQPSICIRVPSVDLSEGTWQVMVHTREVVASSYELKVTTWGVPGTIEPDRHGHKPEDGAFTIDKHEIEPCAAAGA